MAKLKEYLAGLFVLALVSALWLAVLSLVAP